MNWSRNNLLQLRIPQPQQPDEDQERINAPTMNAGWTLNRFPSHNDPEQGPTATEQADTPPAASSPGWKPLLGVFVGRGTKPPDPEEPTLSRSIQSTSAIQTSSALDAAMLPPRPLRRPSLPSTEGKLTHRPPLTEGVDEKSEVMKKFMRCMNQQQTNSNGKGGGGMVGPDSSQQRKIHNMTTVGGARLHVTASSGSKIRMTSMHDLRQKLHTVSELCTPSDQNQEFAPVQHSSENRLQDVMLQKLRALEDSKDPPAPSSSREEAPPPPTTSAAAAEPARDILEELIELKLRVANQQSVIDTLSSRNRLAGPGPEHRPPAERCSGSRASARESPEGEWPAPQGEHRAPPGERDWEAAEPGEQIRELTLETSRLKQEHQCELADLEDENHELRSAIKALRMENTKYQRELELMKKSMTSADGIERVRSVSSINASRRLKRRSSLSVGPSSGNDAFTLARPKAVEAVQSSSFGWY